MQVRAKEQTRQLAVTCSSNSNQFTKVTYAGESPYCLVCPPSPLQWTL